MRRISSRDSEDLGSRVSRGTSKKAEFPGGGGNPTGGRAGEAGCESGGRAPGAAGEVRSAARATIASERCLHRRSWARVKEDLCTPFSLAARRELLLWGRRKPEAEQTKAEGEVWAGRPTNESNGAERAGGPGSTRAPGSEKEKMTESGDVWVGGPSATA